MNKKTTRPKPGDLLYKNLFVKRDRTAALELVSEGLQAFTQNASSLLQEAKILVDNKKFARARFLVATADEEMAKSYIMLDACRLDFASKKSCLKCLCRAFYSHVEKQAYNEVIRHGSVLHDMTQVRQLFHDKLVRWWPGEVESGEPDMPHDTYFARELPLYVDFIDYDQSWVVPSDRLSAMYFQHKLGHSVLSESSKALKRILYTLNKGLYKPEVLNILNEVFCRHYINESTSLSQLSSLYEMIAEKIQDNFGIHKSKFDNSALKEWPLYHFLQIEPR